MTDNNAAHNVTSANGGVAPAQTMEQPMGFLIKSYHSPDGQSPKRVFFWQTPWVVECHAYTTVNDYGETVTRTSREIGGWVTWSGAATIYEDPQEAQAVSAMRRLFGDVVDASRYLQPSAER